VAFLCRNRSQCSATCLPWSFEEDRKREFDYNRNYKIATVFALMFPTSLMPALAQGTDEANAVVTERDLATAYLKSDADGIAQGVKEDYTPTHSMGKITTRSDDIGRQRKMIPNTKSSRIAT
jgi:hypothetical protein